MAISLTAGREITEAEIKQAEKVAKEFSSKFSIEGLTKPTDVKKVLRKAGEAFVKRVGRDGGCTVDAHGLVFTFDNQRLNR